MTNLELMLLEHAASLSYVEITTTVTSDGATAVRMKTKEGAANAFVHLRLNSDVKLSGVSFDERDKDGDVVTKFLIKCQTTTDVIQMLDKLTVQLNCAKLDATELRKPYMSQPQTYKMPTIHAVDMPPIPMPYREADHSIGVRNNLVLGLWHKDGELAPASITVDDTATDAFSFGCYGHNRKPPLPAAPAQTTTAKGDDE